MSLSEWVDRFRGTVPGGTRHRLHAARFGRMAESLRALVELGDDARDKLQGEWILDRSYVVGFVQKALDRAREVVFDATVLTGADGADLFTRLDEVRATLRRLTGRRSERGEAAFEDLELSILREAIRQLALPSAADVASDLQASPAPDLAGVLRDAHEDALRSFSGLHLESWGRRAGTSIPGMGFPASLRVVDVGGAGASNGARGGPSGSPWETIRCHPFRVLVQAGGACGSPASGSDEPRPRALGILGVERATVAVEWSAGRVLIDARLGPDAEANFVYCARRGNAAKGGPDSPGRLLDGSHFRLLGLGPGETGWTAGRSGEETQEILERLGGSLAGALAEPSARYGGPRA